MSRAVAGGWQLVMGATPVHEGVRFRVWAPDARSMAVSLVDEGISVPMHREHDGMWCVVIPEARPGTRYRYRLDDGQELLDPYSRSQSEGVHGPSEVIDPAAFEWHDQDWPGLTIKGQVMYEVHVGTATPEGTFHDLIKDLPRLKSLGITAIEPLPVAAFPGSRNWGYDGVDLFAPTSAYGGPGALKRFIDAAHQHGIGVILDVVYNHLGPDGNYLRQFSADYFTNRYHTPWGDAVNYDGPNSAAVRRYVEDNALYWMHEFHADGLRLDATHAIFDTSETHILAELTQAVRASLPENRSAVLIAETHENDVRYLMPVDQGGFGFDAVWADDFHHCVRAYLAGDREGYYADFAGTLEELARCIEQGWLYEGQPTPRSGHKVGRGTPARDVPAWQFVYVLQNHDQVGNRPFGDRLHHDIDLDRFRAASTLLLFLPHTPMLFMGQEFAASSPFQFFTDHNPELGRLVTEGRRKEFKAFSAFADPATRERIPDPQDESTFSRSRLRLDESKAPPGSEMQRLYAEAIHLRRTDPVLRTQDRHAMEARALGRDLLAVRRWLGAEERLLLVNFGDAEARTDAYGGGWRAVLESGGSALNDPNGVTMAPKSASILARGTG